MQVDHLKGLLEEIVGILRVSGATSAERDVNALIAALTSRERHQLQDLLAEMESKLNPAAAKSLAIARHAAALSDAGLDEGRFRSAFDALQDEKALDKNDILAIAKRLNVIRMSPRSRASALESIEKDFFWRLYNRDADAMAKRATPW